ncbi:MAG TPA: hypothetical protein VFW34_03870 [Candidatus Rubrimentiphilum sp.]|nr:hypothetical protein [Candidatus Rubrimentiphilum sp.]
MADRQYNQENISKRLASLIVTRSPSSRGEIPVDNLAERDSENRARVPQPVRQGDAGEADRQG